jgi:DNA-binding NarL/FixJ family response regulator
MGFTIEMKSVNLMIVDDEALLREGLRSLLKQEPFIRNIYEAGNAAEFKNVIDENSVDMILMDIRIPGTNGIELLHIAKKEYPDVNVIAVTGLEGVELIINLLKAGVQGVVFKLDGYGEILKAIKAVLAADNYFAEKIIKIIQANANRWDHIPPVLLNPIENEMMKALARGLTTKAIAAQMKMSEPTTETYRIRLIKKLGVSNTAALLAYAYRNGIL